MSLVQKKFEFTQADVDVTRRLVTDPEMRALLVKVLLVKEQDILDDLLYAVSVKDQKKVDDCAGYHRAIEDFWPSLERLAQRDIASEQAKRRSESARNE